MQKNHLTIRHLSLTSPVILAPMAGITSLPYRRIMKSCGAGLVFTEMISANGLIRDGAKTRQLLVTHQSEFPLGVQLFGNEPEVLVEAIRRLDDDTQIVDLNMGCPVRKVIGSGAGSALLRDPLRIAAIIAAIRTVYTGALTIKIRSGWDTHSINYCEIGRIAQEQGVDAITLHPRTRCQGFSGQARWEQIAELKQCLTIPVIGSGDIFTAEDGLAMFRQTGCDGVMIGRGGYGNPWLIHQLNALLSGEEPLVPTPGEKLQMIHHHLQLHCQQFGERKTVLEMRKHLSWYARGMEGASQFRSRVQSMENLQELTTLTDHFFQQEAP